MDLSRLPRFTQTSGEHDNGMLYLGYYSYDIQVPGTTQSACYKETIWKASRNMAFNLKCKYENGI
jgi:hypothetical protein